MAHPESVSHLSSDDLFRRTERAGRAQRVPDSGFGPLAGWGATGRAASRAAARVSGGGGRGEHGPPQYRTHGRAGEEPVHSTPTARVSGGRPRGGR